MKWINTLNRKFGRFGIPHLMILLSSAMLGVFLADLLLPDMGLSALLMLNTNLVAQGQVWRLITFIFLPPNTSVLWILFSLYFYCLLGNLGRIGGISSPLWRSGIVGTPCGHVL